MYSVDVIIPTYRPGNEFEEVLQKLSQQSYPVNQILVMNTEEKFWNKDWENRYDLLKVRHLRKEEFDHGRTRREAAEWSNADFMVFMTQDAMPENDGMIKNLVERFDTDPLIGAVYGRQLPAEDCNELERFTRVFNYPEKSYVRTKADLPKYGIKTFFCSNVCAAYKKETYEKLGGFVEKTIFNEDMIYAGKLIENGYAVAYAAEARVIHSHNYSCMQQLHRNFDLGVSQAQNPDVFAGIVSEGEGIRLVKKTLVHILKKGKIWLVPKLIIQSGCKYIGFFAGKRYEKLPKAMVVWFSMNKTYWK